VPAIVKELVQVVRGVGGVPEEGREQHTVVEENGEECQGDQRQRQGRVERCST
jgi:hypothetical protein